MYISCERTSNLPLLIAFVCFFVRAIAPMRWDGEIWYYIIDDIAWRNFAVSSLSDVSLLGNNGIQPFLS